MGEKHEEILIRFDVYVFAECMSKGGRGERPKASGCRAYA
ncbi:hypothetical protein ShirakiTA10_12250 [Bacillus safensis]|nr:hypothetical protein ShirakiTA10_12250 [Bacillus safensis]